MFDGRWRAGVDRRTGPLGSALHRTGITADQLTAAGIVLAAGAAAVIASGHLAIGVAVLVAAALPDLLDGPLAKAAGTASRRGAFFDSVSDRVTDALLLGGVAWYLASSRGAHAALLPFAVLGASNLVSYVRAKAESLGFDARGGLMERAERIVVLALGLLVPILLLPALWLILGLSLVTALQRFVKVIRQSDSSARSVALASRWTVAAMEARWKARRQAAAELRPNRRFRTRRRTGSRHHARTRP
ncbi:MAG TPA: CDP-alcohol phosphatidyltransferase family protein [Acidimicrobiales bacterium]|nr:CDP-alcohol phosphatidyltransferase family protein [Acidimicrobiales bacterium]